MLCCQRISNVFCNQFQLVYSFFSRILDFQHFCRFLRNGFLRKKHWRGSSPCAWWPVATLCTCSAWSMVINISWNWLITWWWGQWCFKTHINFTFHRFFDISKEACWGLLAQKPCRIRWHAWRQPQGLNVDCKLGEVCTQDRHLFFGMTQTVRFNFIPLEIVWLHFLNESGVMRPRGFMVCIAMTKRTFSGQTSINGSLACNPLRVRVADALNGLSSEILVAASCTDFGFKLSMGTGFAFGAIGPK